MKFLDILTLLLFNAKGWFSVTLQVLFVVGLWFMFKKSGVKSWLALIPGVRLYQFGRCAGRETEGRVLCILEIASTLMGIVGNVMTNPSETVAMIVVALQLPMYIAIIAYSIRVYFGICDVYGKPRSWVWLWVFVDGVVALIWGILPDFRPSWQVEDLRKQVKEIFGGHNVAGMSDGLTVNLEERTAKDLFSKKYLLRDIHMYIHPGHMVLLLGGSGAGKTTFLNAVNGYEKAKAKVTLNGSDVYGEYKKMQYEVGFVPQQELMRGKDTVFSTLMDASLLRIPIEVSAAERRARVEEVMKIFGLAPVKGSLVDKLSGGQKKRLSIAMEFLSNPSLFILDEPDSGLDGVMARELMEQLRKIADQGKIVIVITHTPDRVIDLFDDVIVLAKDSNRTGRLAYFGPIKEAQAFFGRERMEQIVMCINRQEEGGEGRADEFIARYAEVQNG